MKIFLHNFGKNLVGSFLPPFLYAHFFAWIGTYFLLETDVDWNYFVWAQQDFFHTLAFPMIVIGGLLPILLPVILLFFSWLLKNKKMLYASAVSAQGAFFGWLISSTYKSFTGRVQPNFSNTILDNSHSFHFGFWQHGIFWGWPSSHTTTSFALAMALVFAFPKNKIIRFVAPLYALCVGLGTTVGIHWFSEFFAGIFIGSAVGIVVGKSFYKMSKSFFASSTTNQ
jgi:membrane-associated phospholipid phosphatase